MRRWWIAMVAVVVVAALGAGSARACMICSQGLSCTWSPAGGRWCFSGSSMCALGGLCPGGGNGSPKPIEEVQLFQMTLLAAPVGAPPAPARVVRGAGEVTTGRHALRVARRGVEPEGGEDRIVFTGHGVAGGGTALVRSHSGDGFTLSLEPDGRGAQVRVCTLAGGAPGRELAGERLGDTDALVVPVSFEGRPALLVLQSATLRADEGRRRDADAARAADDAMAGRPQPVRPAFELRVLDR